MKPKPNDLWQRLVHQAQPAPDPADAPAIDRIVSKLRWQPPEAMLAVPWASVCWSLTGRVALPAATGILIAAACWPIPRRPASVEQVDDLIAATLQQP